MNLICGFTVDCSDRGTRAVELKFKYIYLQNVWFQRCFLSDWRGVGVKRIEARASAHCWAKTKKKIQACNKLYGGKGSYTDVSHCKDHFSAINCMKYCLMYLQSSWCLDLNNVWYIEVCTCVWCSLSPFVGILLRNPISPGIVNTLVLHHCRFFPSMSCVVPCSIYFVLFV